MKIVAPYLLFIGDAVDPLSIKMARSAAHWCPQDCVGEHQLPGCEVTTGLSNLSIEQAAEAGAKTLVLGFANSGGTLDPNWVPTILQALDSGMDIVSGLHDRLVDIPTVKESALKLNRQLIDIRHPKNKFATANGKPRSGKRLLTVGTDCSVGKMYTSLSIYHGLRSRKVNATFRATGQCGILISGAGVAVDCVISDFISGSVEQLAPDNEPAHWDIIEGQGSLSHPAFSGVSLGLLHGAQPDAIVVCHALNRHHMRGLPHYPIASIEQTIALNEQAARLTNSAAKVVAISINTSSVDEDQAHAICAELSKQFGLPVIDPVRHDINVLLDSFL